MGFEALYGDTQGLLVSGLVTMGLWWYANSGHRLVDPELPQPIIRRIHMTMLVGPPARSR